MKIMVSTTTFREIYQFLELEEKDDEVVSLPLSSMNRFIILESLATLSERILGRNN